MGADAQLYLIDRKLRVSTLADRLEFSKGARGRGDSAPPEGGDLPLVPTPLEAGIVYPAADGSPRGFALPTYKLREDAGRYQATLKWIAVSGSGGPIARLSVVFDRIMPAAAAGITLSELSHVATARLLYRIPLETRTGEAGGAVLAIDLGAVTPTDASQARIDHDLYVKADFDRLWSTLTSPASEARIELRFFATVGRRTWRQLIPDRIKLADQADLLTSRGVLLTHMIDVTKFVPQVAVDKQRRVVLDPIVYEKATWSPHEVGARKIDTHIFAPATVSVARTVDRAGMLRTAMAAQPLSFQPMMRRHIATPIVAQPAAIEAVAEPAGMAASRHVLHAAFRKKALKSIDRGALTKLPIRAFVDASGQPVLITVRVEALQSVPFSFDPNVNAYMFDVPGDLRPTVTRVMLRHEYDAGAGRPPLVYYQDSAFPSRFHYEPQEFRIPRADRSPHLPEIRLAFYDLVEEDQAATPAGEQGSEGTIVYRVRVAYRAVPYVDHVILDGLRRTLRSQHPDASLSALVSEGLALTLWLPSEDGGETVATPRPEAKITLDDGIVDEFELSPAQLAAFVTLIQTGGVAGMVTGSLPGAQNTEIPVRLSLRDTAGVLTERTFQGSVGERVLVRLRNRLESPLTVTALYPTPVEGAVAFPRTDPGLTVAAGDVADLSYVVEPPGVQLLDLDPLLSLTVTADLDALLPKVMESQGYASNSFAVPVTVDAAYFGQTMPGDAEALTALRVEFENDDEVVLDAASPAQDAILRVPILDWLMKRPDGHRYRRRVVNLHGTETLRDGAAGPWVDGAGEGALVVVPVGG